MDDSVAVDAAQQLTVIVPTNGTTQAVERVLRQLDNFAVSWIVVQAAASEPMPTVPKSAAGNMWMRAPASRGGQIAAAIARCRTDWIWVVHDDTDVTESAFQFLYQAVTAGKPLWGRFNVSFRERNLGLRMVAALMNIRSRYTKICTGDQAMFFHRSLLDAVGGFPPQRLMEDIEISARLRQNAPQQFVAATEVVTTSGQRWLVRGFWRTVVVMWILRSRYYFGADPDVLFNDYYGDRS